MMHDKPNSLQDTFLNACRKEKQQITIYLNSGVKLQGVVTGFDNFSVLLRRGPQIQLVYKHGIATIVPLNPLSLYNKDAAVEAAVEGDDISTLTEEGSFQIA
jgi:host factor-I protein